MPLERVISGGQTGVDQAALAAAKEVGVETGGWAPARFLTTKGPNPDLDTIYGLRETKETGYVPRNRLNVLHSDGTVAFYLRVSNGTRYTMRFCESVRKPLLVITDLDDNAVSERIAEFIEENGIATLNVAGSREVSAEVFTIITAALTSAFSQASE